MSLDLSSYGIIGDMRTCALVSDSGSIDWLCAPRFDSPAVLLRLLDDQRGGFCDIRLTNAERSERRYLPGTNILETILLSDTGSLRLTDFFSLRQSQSDAIDSESDGQCLRVIECTSGFIEFKVVLRPTFGFATCSHREVRGEAGLTLDAEVDGAPAALNVQWSANLHDLRHGEWHAQLAAGEKAWFSIQSVENVAQVEPLRNADIDRKLTLTRSYWEAWSSRFAYRGRWEGAILRSILCLKLLTYAPTGAIAAAATCGLPEVIGGERNWDYRFCWLRDASFTVSSFLNCGYRHEARAFLDFIAKKDPTNGNDLKILYSLTDAPLEQRLLEHLSGWKNSRPVRIGNEASEQVQLDIYGEYLSALAMYLDEAESAEVEELRPRVTATVRNILHFVEQHWRDADQGIWELQLPPEQHLHSKGMCSVAIDRALKLNARLVLNLDEQHWRSLQTEIQQDYLTKAWSESEGALMQTYGLTRLDASVMRLVLYNALSTHEARTRSTITAIVERLAEGDLVYRYRGEDGLPGQEGCFTVCSFWLASMYAFLGDAERATGIVDRMLRRANDLGLLSEEMLPGTDEQIGNFPQAFTHMGLVNNGMRVLELLRERPTTQDPAASETGRSVEMV